MSDQNDSNVASSAADDQGTVEEIQADPVEGQSEVSETAEQSIPFSRFQEVNEKVKEYGTTIAELNAKIEQMQSQQIPGEPEDPNLTQAKEYVKSLGFITKEEQEQMLQQSQAQAKADAELQQQLTRLETEYSGKDGGPKFNRNEVIRFAVEKGIPDPEMAFKLMKEKELTDFRIQQALTKTKGVKSETSDGTGSTQSGTTDDDLKEGIAAGDKGALRTYLKRISQS